MLDCLGYNLFDRGVGVDERCCDGTCLDECKPKVLAHATGSVSNMGDLIL